MHGMDGSSFHRRKEPRQPSSDVGAGELEIRSLALLVSSVRGDGAPLFPRESPHNFCYLTIDPLQRQVKLWYSAFMPMMW